MFLVIDKKQNNKKIYRLIDEYQDLNINILFSKSEKQTRTYLLKKGKYHDRYEHFSEKIDYPF